MAAVGLFVWRGYKTVRTQQLRALALRCGLSNLRESDGLRATYRPPDGSAELGVRFESYSALPPEADERRSQRMPLTGIRVTIDGAGSLVPLSLSREPRGELWPQHATRASCSARC